MWRQWSIVRSVKLQLVKFVRLQGSPDDIAKGVALGVFIGMTPTFGFQMIIAAFAATIFRENRLAAILGVWVTNPFTAPFIYVGEYEVGRLLMQLERVSFVANFSFSSLLDLSRDILYPVTLGSLVVGPLIAFLTYTITLRAIPSLKAIKLKRWPRMKRIDK
jgi:uncharacterized protein (DUF2062 family)